jgi:hypothetical protein
MNLQSVLERIERGGLSVSLRDEWDVGWCVQLGDFEDPLIGTLDEAAQWLHQTALEHYPQAYGTHAETQSPLGAFNLRCVLLGLYESEYRVGLAAASRHRWAARLNIKTHHLSSLDAVTHWFYEEARRQDPKSDFALHARTAIALENWVNERTGERDRCNQAARVQRQRGKR